MANTAKLELQTILVPRRGRGGNGSSTEIQVLGVPHYPAGQKGPKIADYVDATCFKGFNVEEMTKFISGLGFDICVLAVEGLNMENRSADKREEHSLKTKGNMLIDLKFADEKNYAAKVKATETLMGMMNKTFEEVVEIMVREREEKAKK